MDFVLKVTVGLFLDNKEFFHGGALSQELVMEEKCAPISRVIESWFRKIKGGNLRSAPGAL